MAETIEMWLTRQLRDVEEDGKETATIQLVAGDANSVLDRWDKPLRHSEGGPKIRELTELIQEIISSNAETWSAKRTHAVTVIALDGHGIERARYPLQVRGKSQSAQANMNASESVQHASAMQAHVETMRTLLGAATHQNQLLSEQNEKLMHTVTTLTGQLLSQKIEKALEKEEKTTEMQQEMWETAKALTPQMMAMAVGLLSKN